MVSESHLFLVNSEHFDVSFDETFSALKLIVKENLFIKESVPSGIIALSHRNYVFVQPDPTLPLISAPIDAGYIGDITLITSRPITLPKGYTFYLMELVHSNNECIIPKDMKLRKPAYKGDIGRDAYLKKSAKNSKDIQFVIENNTGTIFFPRSSAARKGYEVHVTSSKTTVRSSQLKLITKEDAYSVVQCVNANVLKYTDPVEFVDENDALFMLNKLRKTSERGANKEGSSDSKVK